MYDIYHPMYLTINQKLAYVQLLSYLSKIDSSPELIEKEFTHKLIVRLQIPAESLENLQIPSNKEEVYDVLRPIRSREIAVDLVHCLWFAASMDGIVTDEEIELIRKIAEILGLDDNKTLEISHFVQDELIFFERAQQVLETDEVRC